MSWADFKAWWRRELGAERNDPWRRAIRISLGIFFVGLGIVGIFLPVLQGLLFIAMGFGFLSLDIPAIRRLWCWLKSRFGMTSTMEDCPQTEPSESAENKENMAEAVDPPD